MAIRITWENSAKTVIYMLFEGRWLISDFDAAVHQLIAMSASVPHPVYTLCDMTRGGIPPVGILWQARRAYSIAPPNWNGTVIAARTKLILDLFATFIKTYAPEASDKIIMVGTCEEARLVLERLVRQGVETN